MHYLETENVQGCALIGKGVHYLERVCTVGDGEIDGDRERRRDREG